jgi:hypothetical protein
MRIAVCVLGLALSTAALADDKPVKWEYAELSFRGQPGRPAGKDKDGNEAPATQGTLSLRWTTGTDDISVKGWDELAEKLKVQLKKDSSTASQKIQVLNSLGSEGWELVDTQAVSPVVAGGMGNPPGGGFGGPGGGVRATSTSMMFKRRVK